MATRVIQGFQFFELYLERTTKGTLLPIYNEIQEVLLHKKMFKDFTIFTIYIYIYIYREKSKRVTQQLVL